MSYSPLKSLIDLFNEAYVRMSHTLNIHKTRPSTNSTVQRCCPTIAWKKLSNSYVLKVISQWSRHLHLHLQSPLVNRVKWIKKMKTWKFVQNSWSTEHQKFLPCNILLRPGLPTANSSRHQHIDSAHLFKPTIRISEPMWMSWPRPTQCIDFLLMLTALVQIAHTILLLFKAPSHEEVTRGAWWKINIKECLKPLWKQQHPHQFQESLVPCHSKWRRSCQDGIEYLMSWHHEHTKACMNNKPDLCQCRIEFCCSIGCRVLV